MKTYIRSLIVCGSMLALGSSASHAQVVIGSWQNSTDEGWVSYNTPASNNYQPDANAGKSITDPAVSSEYSFVAAGVPGFAQSLDINYAGYGGGIQLNIAGIPSDLTAFNNNHLLSFTFGVPASSDTSGYSQIYNLNINAPGYGYNNIPWSSTTAVDLAGSNNNQSGDPNYYWGPAGSVRAQTVTFDYSSILPAIQAGGESYVNLTLTFNNAGGDLSQMYMNNVVLSGGPVPEPASMALLGLGALVGTFVIRRRK
ncbi:MAG TPA: PEP-CTERM sorting domain-containing protein [Verrucomicrobiae bacterium]|nr:PEP-CTERM sorting domain-containing protein [Verrucomicrobiae bacterium]